MSGDSLSTLGPSDSGFLNSFLASNPSTPLNSKVGEEKPRSEQNLADEPTLADPLAGDDSVLMPDAPVADAMAPDAMNATSPDAAPNDAQLDRVLRQPPVPDGLLARLHRSLDDGSWDSEP